MVTANVICYQPLSRGHPFLRTENAPSNCIRDVVVRRDGKPTPKKSDGPSRFLEWPVV
jgi:hypothetical protein